MNGNFVCNVCGKQFLVKNGLYDHNWAVHTEVESPCNVCDKTFRSKTKLAYHIKTTLAEKESFNCDIKSGEIQCIFYTTTKSNLRAHKKRVHEKTNDVIPPKLVCGLCGYRTNNKFNLDRHSDKCKKSLDQNPIDHSCNFCQKKFSSKKILTRHAKLHNRASNDKPSSEASCVVCKKTFVNTWNMERHTLKDHGLTEKGNVIENSAGIAIFTTEALVKETVIERRPERLLHQCDMCHYNSVKKANLRRHKQVKHDGMTRPEMRGRKNKTGPLSDRTKRRRMTYI